ncbi:BQ00720 family protein [Rhizobium sp. LEGMi12c]
MLLKEATARLTASELANIGTGEVAYIRKMEWSEVSRCFPEAPDIDPDVDLWALFGADGTPILLTDNRSSTFYRAAEDELKTVSLH